jgi:hypothetical protein
MTDKAKGVQVEYWARKFDDIDREIARLATMCNVRILDAGVIERVLHNDASVCGTQNKIAFDKMRSLLMMHYSVRDSAIDVCGRRSGAGLVPAGNRNDDGSWIPVALTSTSRCGTGGSCTSGPFARRTRWSCCRPFTA